MKNHRIAPPWGVYVDCNVTAAVNMVLRLVLAGIFFAGAAA
jgi:hypothetical protein